MPPPQPRAVVGAPSVLPFLPSSNVDDLSNLLDHEGLDSDAFNPSLFDYANNAIDDGLDLDSPIPGLDPGVVDVFGTYVPNPTGAYGMDGGGVVQQQFSGSAMGALHPMLPAPAPMAATSAARQAQPKKR